MVSVLFFGALPCEQGAQQRREQLVSPTQGLSKSPSAATDDWEQPTAYMLLCEISKSHKMYETAILVMTLRTRRVAGSGRVTTAIMSMFVVV